MAGNFYSVECPDCENEQIVFDKASTEVACAVCGHTLARPTGGKADIEGEVIETVENRSTTDLGDAGETAEAR
ncbi:30S ribosomal protein S27e [Halalkalicoccus paucihalophilus]|uniref:Small ribosomal subunit protein eS27 n=1 Tax=Halalkalicoccus paucihalophilus TaxID=1008153 RepID=A0A151AE37_9EURY|nr:30S ribosomal protein S27e [Halalkalicoccus paucihalophilus]KYH25938.1 30S ribosomal protein S27e [Halalkalicoccus paucihalophilus]MCL7418137.1 30S ribosomal protein S27e [Halalkalicoccus sp.]